MTDFPGSLRCFGKDHVGEGKRRIDHLPDLPWPEPTRVPPPWEGGDGKAIDQAPTLAGGVREERQH